MPIDTSVFADHLVFSSDEIETVSGDLSDSIETAHSETFALDSGTIALLFIADSTSDRQTLFSKGHRGYQGGGHLTAQIVDGRLEARLQTDSRGVTLRSAIDSIKPGEEHHLALAEL